jgi:hypothetical protein
VLAVWQFGFSPQFDSIDPNYAKTRNAFIRMLEQVTAMKSTFALALPFAAATLLSTIPASASTLNGDELRRLVTGRTVYLAAPLGGEFPLKYKPNGTVTGDGEAVGLGRFYATRETGRWFMQGDQLCQQFPTWYSGTRLCFTVQDLGNRRIRWTRDNGQTGVARVSDH